MELTREMADFILGHFQCRQPPCVDCRDCKYSEVCCKSLDLLRELSGRIRTPS